MVDIGFGAFGGQRSRLDERKLIKFPSVTDGRLADAISLLSRPGSEAELGSEAQFRSMYRSMAASWPVPRRRRNRFSLLVGAASVASIFATATGLSAASVIPAPAAHVVNGIVQPLDVAGTPTAGSGGVAAPPVQTSGPSATGAHAGGTAPGSTPTSPVVTSSASANPACRHGKGSCAPRHSGVNHVNGSNTPTSSGSGVAVATGPTVGTGGGGGVTSTTATAAATGTTSGTTGTGTSTSSSSSSGTGSGSGSTGTGRGGNEGAGNGHGAGHHGHRHPKGAGGAPGDGTASSTSTSTSSSTSTSTTTGPANS